MKHLYWLWLAESGLHNQKDALLKKYGTIEEIYHQSIFSGWDGWKPDLAELEERLEQYQKRGIGFCCIEEEEYPRALREIYNAPGWLYYRGHLPKESHFIAIVGARACTAHGNAIAEHLGCELARAGVGVVSGLALGIDGAAQRGCICAGGVTYGVMGCGVDVCYPKENRDIYDRIVERGGILSEYPPGTSPLPAYFPKRNRIISGMSDGVVVVEARRRSGSLITAELGLEQGKNIYAVPGRPEDVLSEGCNELIQSGAKLIRNASDILSDYEFETKLHTHLETAKKIVLESAEKIVYSCLRLEPKHVNQLQKESGLEWQEVLSALLKLELKGYVKQVSMDCFILS